MRIARPGPPARRQHSSSIAGSHHRPRHQERALAWIERGPRSCRRVSALHPVGTYCGFLGLTGILQMNLINPKSSDVPPAGYEKLNGLLRARSRRAGDERMTLGPDARAHAYRGSRRGGRDGPYLLHEGRRHQSRPATSQIDLSEETSNGLDTPEAARNLHRHGNQRLLRREAVDHEFVLTLAPGRARSLPAAAKSPQADRRPVWFRATESWPA